MSTTLVILLVFVIGYAAGASIGWKNTGLGAKKAAAAFWAWLVPKKKPTEAPKTEVTK